MKKTSLTLAIAMVLGGKAVQATPSTIDLPVDLTYSNNQYCVSISSQCGNGWSFWQHKTGYHKANGGIDKANDAFAWDVNLNTPSFNSDKGKPVRAVESGNIYTGKGWKEGSSGQILINHSTNGDNWSSGYLHMSSITSKKARCISSPSVQNCSVQKGEIIGYVSSVGGNNDHLHFAVYNSHGKASLVSVNANFSGRTAGAYPPVDQWTGKNPSGTACEKDAKTVASKVGRYGTLELRWSGICKTNWTRIASNSSSYSTTAKVVRSSDSLSYSASGKGSIFTNMVSASGIKVCASGTVNGESLSGACY